MVKQRNYLSEASEALCDTAASPRQRLQRAASLLRQAYVYQGTQWPEPMRQQAEAILITLIADGRMVRNIAQMDEQAVEQLCHELTQLLDNRERLA